MPRSAASKRLPTTRDPERTRSEILAVATEHFARHGLSGARVDKIAAQTNTSKRMIYYYFGSKEGLYQHVLYNNYARIRAVENHLDLEDVEPVESIVRLIWASLLHYNAFPELVHIVALENILEHGETLAQFDDIEEVNNPIIETLSTIMSDGLASGAFSFDPADLNPVDIHQTITSLVFYRITNRHTFKLAFNRNMASTEQLKASFTHISRVILLLLGASLEGLSDLVSRVSMSLSIEAIEAGIEEKPPTPELRQTPPSVQP